jgi:hypothetical protein
MKSSSQAGSKAVSRYPVELPVRCLRRAGASRIVKACPSSSRRAGVSPGDLPVGAGSWRPHVFPRLNGRNFPCRGDPTSSTRGAPLHHPTNTCSPKQPHINPIRRTTSSPRRKITRRPSTATGSRHTQFTERAHRRRRPPCRSG